MPADRVFAYDHPHRRRPTVITRLRTKFGERAFSHTAWNRLPEDIRAEPDITNFRTLLKTHYFNSALTVFYHFTCMHHGLPVIGALEML